MILNEDTLWLHVPAAEPHVEIHPANLGKPSAPLDKLEQIVIKLAALQGTEQPCIDQVNIILFAADHGMAIEGISAFPQSVTAEMMTNFAHGSSVTRVLTDKLGTKLEVINLGTVADLESIDGVINSILGPGTANFCREPAMSKEQLSRAINTGRQSAQRIKLCGTQLFICGEMNRRNTTAATAMTCALLDIPPEQLAGIGGEQNEKDEAHKTKLIRQALTHHKEHLSSPLEILRRLGGFEIAALTGSYLCSAHMGLPVLIDSFTSSVAALTAARLCPGAEQWFLFSQTSTEPGHKIVLDALDAKPLLDINMNIGEGSGAAITLSLLRQACAIHNEKVTFSEADVSERLAFA